VVAPFAVGTLAKPRICCAAGVLACLSCCANGLAKLLNDILSTATARPSRVTRSEPSACKMVREAESTRRRNARAAATKICLKRLKCPKATEGSASSKVYLIHAHGMAAAQLAARAAVCMLLPNAHCENTASAARRTTCVWHRLQCPVHFYCLLASYRLCSGARQTLRCKLITVTACIQWWTLTGKLAVPHL